MKFKVFSSDGSSSKEKTFEAYPQLEGDKGIEALRQVIITLQANQRQGNACTKTRGEVRGSGKKPWRQKGTGMARAGSRRSPIWRKGGVVFGPKPRDYTKKINRKVRRLAFQRALSDLVAEEGIKVIESFAFEKAKTSAFASLLKTVGLANSKVLVVDDGFDDATVLSVRNLPNVSVSLADTLNPLEIASMSQVLITEGALQKVIKRTCEEEACHVEA